MTERLSGPGHSKTALRRGMGKFANPPPGAAATTAEEQAFLMGNGTEESARGTGGMDAGMSDSSLAPEKSSPDV